MNTIQSNIIKTITYRWKINMKAVNTELKIFQLNNIHEKR